MTSWHYDINDVLRITHKGKEVIARVAGYFDQLDNSKPLYVNLRVSEGKRWGERQVKIQPGQVIEALPDWYEKQHEAWEASIKATADAAYARMSDAEKLRLDEWAKQRQRRSPIEMLVDQACGLD